MNMNTLLKYKFWIGGTFFLLVIGVIVGTYSSIYIASPLLLIFGEGIPAKPERQREVAATTARP